MRTEADWEYQQLIFEISGEGDFVDSRNGPAKSLISAEPVLFYDTPLVTLRRTAWRMALREMEWFLSGDPQCPPELMGWWRGQLNPSGQYLDGYGEQWRAFYQSYSGLYGETYDQIQALLDGIRNHPNSRRLIATTWNPAEMACITGTNDNPNTPTTCHGTVLQAHVRDGMLHLSTYQRSADVMLGVPHNWLQYWALLLWLAYHCNLKPGTLRWLFGDVHLYQHPTHFEAAEAIMDQHVVGGDGPQLIYKPITGHQQKIPVFQADDFSLLGEIPDPVTTIRPLLLAS